MILAALAAAAGIARAGVGMYNAAKQGRTDRDLIKRAYQISKKRLNVQQGDMRQNVGESLNARGVLSGGDNVASSPDVAKALSASGVDPDAATKAAVANKAGLGTIIKSLKGRDTRQQAWENARMATDATRGQTGQGNTLGGGVESDLSNEFLLDQQSLFSDRKQALEQTKRGQSAATVGAIGAGIDTATQVYQAGSMIKGALGSGVDPAAGGLGPDSPGAQVRFPRAASESGRGTSLGGSWFGGYDPVDPLGLSKRGISNQQFNVLPKKE